MNNLIYVLKYNNYITCNDNYITSFTRIELSLINDYF
jgi:hypothetical protein